MSEHRLLMIPGPIELEPSVLAAMGQRSTSHVDPDFVPVMGRAIAALRTVMLAPSAQPFVIAGSGTLAMEMACASLIERGDRALVIDTGYFSARMASILERLGAEVTRVSATPGEVPSIDAIDEAIRATKPTLVAITHVDTSTGVRIHVEPIARLAKEHGALVVLDAVCSAAGEVIRQDAWGIDVVLTGSQKALGAPPGLAVLTVSEAALARRRARKTPPASLYLDLLEWLPIMQAYEAGKPAYFATPAVSLVCALDQSLAGIVREGMETRFERHARVARAFRAAFAALGLAMLPARDAICASTLSAVRYPSGVDASLAQAMRDEGVVIAGGLHPDLKATYFRIGHMGSTDRAELLTTIGALERALTRGGHPCEPGVGVTAAMRALAS
ncbi:MAG: alanine--glyoxylate aminotransferase family protein [Deltaproteobacteria bacterium]|nr:alanine--glyoxylate aminotransferase family protein [Deltaproteobacteria bacterium]